MFQKMISSPLGQLKILASDTGLMEVRFTNTADPMASDTTTNYICEETALQLRQYFNSQRERFDIPLTPSGTSFQQKVWRELLKIPFGNAISYSSIANNMDHPLSVRAVGMANGKNPIAIIIPCHRVIGADGSLTGYAGGIWRKEALLKLEKHPAFLQPSLW